MKERKKFEIIRKVSEIINQYKERKDTVVTIVDLTLPQKGGIMKIFLSIYPKNFEKETIKNLNKSSRSILREVKENIYLRHLPSKIIFYPSDAFQYADEVYKLLKEIKNEIEKS